MRQVKVSLRTKKTWRPELTLAPGPAVLGQPGAGTLSDLYGTPWAVALFKDGPQLLQAQGGEWVDRSDPGALAALDGARHVALAFDQAARPVLAWEHAGQVFVRQWDGPTVQYVTRGPWAGRDPVLFCDAVLLGESAESDVLLYYLAGSDVVSRVQREAYGVARVVASVGTGAVLDQTVAVGNCVQLLGEMADGAPWAAQSPLYPLRPRDGLLGGAWIGGAVVDLLLSVTAADGLVGGGSYSVAVKDLVVQRVTADGLTGAGGVAGSLLASAPSKTGADALLGGGALAGSLLVIGVPVAAGDGMTGAATVGGTLT